MNCKITSLKTLTMDLKEDNNYVFLVKIAGLNVELCITSAKDMPKDA